MEQERSVGSQNGPDQSTPKDDSPEELFRVACYLASRGKPKEAEIAIRRSLGKRDRYPM